MAAIQDSRTASEELAKREELPDDLETFAGEMASFHPVRVINYLVESNPDLSLRDIPKLPPQTVLKAVLHMRMTNDNLLSP